MTIVKNFNIFGDGEFVVLMNGIPQEIFMERCNIFHDLIKSKSDLSMAIGKLWSDNAKDIKRIMIIADENMYNDK